MTLAAIEIDGVSKTYPRSWHRPPKEALGNVSFAVSPGETFGFIGQNGAGKSTLIKILVGVLRPTRGIVRLFGVEARKPSARQGLGFVPENPSLPDHLTPLEILHMALQLHRLSVNDPVRHCLGWLDRFGLQAVANAPLRGFSKGMLQRTALAQALAIQPRLLILDEPLSGLDPVGRKDVVDILGDYRAEGGTLFFSSHVLYDVERIADRFGLIHNGELLTIRSPGDVVADQSARYLLRFRMAGAGVGESRLVMPENLAGEIARIVSAGGVVQEVKPESSLETVFFRTIAATSSGETYGT